MLYVCMLNNFSSPLVVSIAGSGDVVCVDVNACIAYVSMPVYPHMHLLCMSVRMCIYVSAFMYLVAMYVSVHVCM